MANEGVFRKFPALKMVANRSGACYWEGGRTQTIHGWYGLAARLVNPDNNRLLEGLIAGPLSLLDPASSTLRCCAAATWSSEVGRQPTERQGETRGGVTVLTCVFTYIYIYNIYHGVENEYILR